MVRAVALLSGGLDSSLAVKIMMDQGVEVYAMNLITPFCTCTHKGCRHQATKIAESFGIPLKIIFGGQDYIDIVRNPKYGYGSNMNPCLDCRIYMFKKAKEYMEEIGAKFVFTGEVLGQRPMSQHRRALALIERESGMEGLIVRPLSAKLLPPTIPEKMGWVDREKLLDLFGRRRTEQMKLAQRYGIDYPCPSGGCRLTDPNFARRIRDSFEHNEFDIKSMYLLRYGRHFRLASGAKVIVGRNEEENKKLRGFVRESDVLIEVLDFGSPLTILRNCRCDKDMDTAIYLCIRYSDGKNEKRVRLKKIAGNTTEEFHVEVSKLQIDRNYITMI